MRPQAERPQGGAGGNAPRLGERRRIHSGAADAPFDFTPPNAHVDEGGA